MVSAALEGGIPKLPIDGDTGSTTEARGVAEEVRGEQKHHASEQDVSFAMSSVLMHFMTSI